jgi:intracellular sulfur oxidation DsrE/DsrF family protein
MKTVFHISSPDSGDQHHAMVNVANLLADDTVYVPDDEIAILANGAAVTALIEPVEHDGLLGKLIDEGVTIRACNNALRGMGKTPDDLFPEVEAVPSGSGELARLQSEGYGYVKAP